METDVPNSDYLTLAEAAMLLPSRPHTQALRRWCRRGTLARNGIRIRLRHGRAGRHVFTTAAWLREFLEAVAAADCESFDARTPAAAPTARGGRRTRTPAQRQRDFQRAMEELRKHGL